MKSRHHFEWRHFSRYKGNTELFIAKKRDKDVLNPAASMVPVDHLMTFSACSYICLTGTGGVNDIHFCSTIIAMDWIKNRMNKYHADHAGVMYKMLSYPCLLYMYIVKKDW